MVLVVVLVVALGVLPPLLLNVCVKAAVVLDELRLGVGGVTVPNAPVEVDVFQWA